MSPTLKLITLSFIVFHQWIARVDCKSKSYKFWPDEHQAFSLNSPFSFDQQYTTSAVKPSQQELAEHYHDAGSRYQPFAERDDGDETDHHKYSKVEHVEGKEISFMYPVLLALLILGALFIPFISLFFFLAVSAFNCNSLGNSGFGQVTPVFGRRRRRRKRHLDDSEPLDAINNSTRSDGQDSVSTTTSLVQSLPALMLFDAIESASELGAAGDYNFWRKQLARNTVRLQEALAEFADGAWLNLIGDAAAGSFHSSDQEEHEDEDEEEDQLGGNKSDARQTIYKQ